MEYIWLTFCLGLFVGVVCSIGIMFVIMVYPITEEITEDVIELGRSICEEEYGMEYNHYKDGIITCNNCIYTR